VASSDQSFANGAAADGRLSMPPIPTAIPINIPASAISPAGTGAVVAIGAMAGLMPSLQPLLLAGFADEGRISVAEIGHVATAEALGMALSVGLAGVLLRPERLRLVAGAVLLVASGLNLATGQAEGLATILALRVGVGLCSGLMLWLLIGLLARVDLPARVTGFYVVAQGIGAFVLSALFSSFAIPRWGPEGAYGLLAAVGLLLSPVALMVPRRYAQVGVAGGLALPDGPGGLGLLSALAQLAAIMALWVYIVPLGLARGFGEDVVRLGVSVAIGLQIVAGIVAIRFATLPAFRTVMVCAAGSLASIALVALAPAPAPSLFVAGIVAFSLCWVFVLAFQVPLLIELDPSRRSVMLLTCVQLLGVAAGPFLSSTAIGGAGTPTAAAPVSAVLFALAILLVPVARALRR
jgi:hypothetical protein